MLERLLKRYLQEKQKQHRHYYSQQYIDTSPTFYTLFASGNNNTRYSNNNKRYRKGIRKPFPPFTGIIMQIIKLIEDGPTFYRFYI